MDEEMFALLLVFFFFSFKSNSRLNKKDFSFFIFFPKWTVFIYILCPDCVSVVNISQAAVAGGSGLKPE